MFAPEIGRCDALVIGGGPAGLATAIALRSYGLDVSLAEAGAAPIDKACGEGILPAGVEALRRLGIALSASDGARFRGIRFIEDEIRAEAVFAEGCGVGVRRTRLHDLLVARAAAVGVRVHWGVRIRDLTGVAKSCWIVGADGQSSWVRRQAGLDRAMVFSRRYGFRRHYRVAPWSDMVEVYWGGPCQFFVTPVGADEVGVAMLCGDPLYRIDQFLPHYPELARRLRGASQTSRDRGGSTTTFRVRNLFRGRIALVGDASGSVDALGGEGLSLCFQQAVALADAIAHGDLGAYRSAHRRLWRGPALVANLMLLMGRLPRVRRPVWKQLESRPTWFSRVLALHAG